MILDATTLVLAGGFASGSAAAVMTRRIREAFQKAACFVDGLKIEATAGNAGRVAG
jgi:hypothetical protein